MSRKQKIIKRLLDIFFSLLLIIVLIIPLSFLIILATIDTKLFGVFIQERVGQHAKPFNIYKIRTYSKDGSSSKLGKFLRQSKLNELLQLVNVIIGDMSLVGPRPDIRGYADALEGDNKVILSIKPGITGPATIKFIDEEALLIEADNTKEMHNKIWKEKVRLNKDYIINYSLKKDALYLKKTLLLCLLKLK